MFTSLNSCEGREQAAAPDRVRRFDGRPSRSRHCAQPPFIQLSNKAMCCGVHGPPAFAGGIDLGPAALSRVRIAWAWSRTSSYLDKSQSHDMCSMSIGRNRGLMSAEKLTGFAEFSTGGTIQLWSLMNCRMQLLGESRKKPRPNGLDARQIHTSTLTPLALSWMKSRRGSTTAPLCLVQNSS